MSSNNPLNILRDIAHTQRLRAEAAEADASNWRQNYILLANTINPGEDKPALEAATDLINRVKELEAILDMKKFLGDRGL